MGRKLICGIVIVAAAALVTSCGGGSSGGGTITPAGSPTATLSASVLTFGNENLGVKSAMQSVTLTNGGNATLSVSSIKIAGANAGDFSQSNTCGASVATGANCTIGVFFTPTAAGTRTATVTITDNASGSPQSVSLTGTGVNVPFGISPTAPTVLLGATQDFTLTAPATCTSTLFGNVPVTGTTATYVVPQALPSAWTDTVSCTSTVDGTKASATITLNYPTPTITSVSPESLGTLFAFGAGEAANMSLNGTGFLPDTALTTVGPESGFLVSAQWYSWKLIGITVAVGGLLTSAGNAPWDPGFFSFTAADPSGHGGGTSNVGNLAFLGDQNLLAFNPTDMFIADPHAYVIHKFRLADKAPDGDIVLPKTAEEGIFLAISVDGGANGTNDLVLFTTTKIQAFDPTTGMKLLDYTSPGGVQGGAAEDGWAVFSEYSAAHNQGAPNLLGRINLTNTSDVVTVDVYDTPANFPWNFQLTNLNGSLAAVVWSIIDKGAISTFAIPSLQVIQSIQLPHITTDSVPAFEGGWQLQVFDSGPSQGTAVLLSQYDQVLVYVDLATMKEIRRVDLTAAFKNANPPLPLLQSFRIGKDESDGSITVAFADPLNGRTVLQSVDANGKVTPLTTTLPWLATGLQLSTDGGTIFAGNRDKSFIGKKQ